jgi:hydroxymethylpyrimidine pyrophosphatase-like HAD family hydrolase
VTSSFRTNVEVNHPDGQKGIALQYLANAEAEVAQNCDYVTKHKDEHGVAHAFARWVHTS